MEFISFENNIYNDNATKNKDENQENDSEKKCRFCNTISNLDSTLCGIYHYICRSCIEKKRDTHLYGLISQSKGLKKYGISLRDIERVNFNGGMVVYKELPNPRGYGNPMKLYFEFQLKDVALSKYGSIESLNMTLQDKENIRMNNIVNQLRHDQRQDNKQLRSSHKLTKTSKKKNNLKKKKNTETLSTLNSTHNCKDDNHIFNDTEFIIDTQSFEKICSQCGFKETWEEIDI